MSERMNELKEVDFEVIENELLIIKESLVII